VVQEVKEIHRLVGHEEILQNLHPQQVKIVEVVRAHGKEGITKTDLVTRLGLPRKVVTQRLAELRRKKVLMPKWESEPCILLLEYLVKETVYPGGKYTESGRVVHTDLIKEFKVYSRRWTCHQARRLLKLGYVDVEWQYADSTPYNPFYTVTSRGLSLIKAVSPVEEDFVLKWYPTPRTLRVLDSKGQHILGSNFYVLFKRVIDHLSHGQEQVLILLSSHKDTGLTMKEIEDSIASRQVRSSAASVLANLRCLRKKGIAFSVTGHSQKWIILEALVKETGEPWVTAKELEERTGFRSWWIEQSLDDLACTGCVWKKRKGFTEYFAATVQGEKHIRNISPVIRQKGTVWYPTAEALHVLEHPWVK
jgi:hypothetical protein